MDNLGKVQIREKLKKGGLESGTNNLKYEESYSMFYPKTIMINIQININTIRLIHIFQQQTS